jgi:hypothetical protein
MESCKIADGPSKDRRHGQNSLQPFVVDLGKPLTVGELMNILSEVPMGAHIVCDNNRLDAETFPMTCLRYDGKRLVEITIGN